MRREKDTFVIFDGYVGDGEGQEKAGKVFVLQNT